MIFCGDFMPLYFNTAQVPIAKRAFNDAKKLVSYHFRLSENQFKKNKYDVKTLAYLDQQEIQDGTFAHLCKYSYEKPDVFAGSGKTGLIFTESACRTILFWMRWIGLILLSSSAL